MAVCTTFFTNFKALCECIADIHITIQYTYTCKIVPS